MNGGPKGLTLIELLIAISVSLLIAAALYFSLRSAVESWEVTQDQLLGLDQVFQTFRKNLFRRVPWLVAEPRLRFRDARAG